VVGVEARFPVFLRHVIIEAALKAAGTCPAGDFALSGIR
jgi:hypothetical protein